MNMQFTGHALGECHSTTWFESKGDRQVGMARNIENDGKGNKVKDEVVPTGVEIYWSTPKPRRSFLSKLFG